ncbi:hypothetical protein [Mycobacterium sp. PSTR-4-N]|uniref:hypothetical protein n=1 Tax=Mycobacterium sp. PSTR-4-N TaxID=2917745 RepID=UPI001F14ACDF|nr:hypothetical protein [Mycobacterium sp. PSTR-4-N]MCG7593740.1 hypothetical protein [Mycobacterium sp. PSTR-4-N]
MEVTTSRTRPLSRALRGALGAPRIADVLVPLLKSRLRHLWGRRVVLVEQLDGVGPGSAVHGPRYALLDVVEHPAVNTFVVAVSSDREERIFRENAVDRIKVYADSLSVQPWRADILADTAQNGRAIPVARISMTATG